jgi:hypothetical protein
MTENDVANEKTELNKILNPHNVTMHSSPSESDFKRDLRLSDGTTHKGFSSSAANRATSVINGPANARIMDTPNPVWGKSSKKARLAFFESKGQKCNKSCQPASAPS